MSESQNCPDMRKENQMNNYSFCVKPILTLEHGQMLLSGASLLEKEQSAPNDELFWRGSKNPCGRWLSLTRTRKSIISTGLIRTSNFGWRSLFLSFCTIWASIVLNLFLFPSLILFLQHRFIIVIYIHFDTTIKHVRQSFDFLLLTQCFY